MAGGITGIGAFSAGTPLDVVSGSGLISSGLSALSMSNPYMAGLQVLTSVLGGNSVKASKAGTNTQAQSGFANFGNDDAVMMGDRLIDFSNPQSVLIAGAVLVGAIYAYKKFKR